MDNSDRAARRRLRPSNPRKHGSGSVREESEELMMPPNITRGNQILLHLQQRVMGVSLRELLSLVRSPDNLRMFTAPVMDHFEHPRNSGELENPSATLDLTNPACGDELRLTVQIEGGRVREARFKTRGCVTSIAASSALTELIRGRNRTELAAITPDKVSQALGGLPPATFHAAQLAADAVCALVEKMPR